LKIDEQWHHQRGETVVINCTGHTFAAETHILDEKYAVDVRFER